MTRFQVPMRYADWGTNEALVLLRTMLGLIDNDRAPISALEQRVAKELAVQRAYALNSGHGAIVLALRAFRALRPERTEVIVPAYICPSAVSAVRDAGCTPVAVDIRGDLNIDVGKAAERIDSKVLAVLAAHLYGCPADVDALERICRDAGVFLIDDAAQVYGVRHAGRPLGSFGDAGILSFAQSKSIVTGVRGSGGILLLGNPALQAAVERQLAIMPNARSRSKDHLYFLLGFVLTGRLGMTGPNWQRLLSRLLKPPAVRPATTAITPTDAALALAQIDSIALRMETRTRVANLYAEKLTGQGDVTLPQFAPGRYLSRVFALIPDGCSATALADQMRSRGVQTRPGYYLHDWPQVMPNARNFTPRLIELPSWAGLSVRQIDRACAALGSSLARAKPVSSPAEQGSA